MVHRLHGVGWKAGVSLSMYSIYLYQAYDTVDRTGVGWKAGVSLSMYSIYLYQAYDTVDRTTTPLTGPSCGRCTLSSEYYRR